MSSLAAIVLTAYLASARSDTATGLELPVITAVVLGGVNIFGGSGTMAGVLVAVLVLAFVQNALGLAGVTPEEQQIVTGAVLVVTLILFSGSDIGRKACGRSSSGSAPPDRQRTRQRSGSKQRRTSNAAWFQPAPLGEHVTEEHFPLFQKIKAAGYDGVELPLFGGKPEDYRKVGRS